MKTGYSAKLHYGNLFNNKYVLHRFEQNLSLIKPLIIKNDTIEVVEIGGYTADLYEFMKKNNIDTSRVSYSVLDYDDSALKIAKKRGAKPIKIDINFQSISSILGQKKYDIIICTEVLEHLLDPAKHIQEINKHLKKKGHALISLPNENTLVHRLYALIGIGIDQYPFTLYKHLHFPTVKQNEEFVSKHLKIVGKKYYINFEVDSTRMSYLAYFIKAIPDGVWMWLATILPGLFARGTIFLCKKK